MNQLFKSKALREVTENILPFWQKLMDRKNGGFYGKADFYGKIDKEADRGGVLNSRLLWTFSAAYRVTGNKEYLQYGDCAMDALTGFFFDAEYGGLYWLTDYNGKPTDTKKQFYNQAFGIYALSERYLATGDSLALRYAISLYESMEKHGYEEGYGGYIDAKSRDWEVLLDTSLSSKDLNCAKSMNTNLHVLEAYTNLLRCYDNSGLRARLLELLKITIEKIISDEKRFRLFFNNDWTPISDEVSFGHDIEGSWLIYEAALVLGDEDIIKRAKEISLNMAYWVLENGLDSDNGGLINEDGSKIKAWWPQSEAVVGFYNAYELSGDEKFLSAALNMFDYIEKVFVDSENGEWHNETSLDNAPDKTLPKADMWKCPYHNSRMCFEIAERAADTVTTWEHGDKI